MFTSIAIFISMITVISGCLNQPSLEGVEKNDGNDDNSVHGVNENDIKNLTRACFPNDTGAEQPRQELKSPATSNPDSDSNSDTEHSSNCQITFVQHHKMHVFVTV